MDGHAGQLAVGHMDAVARHRLLHHPDMVGADLVTQPAGPAVDHHAHLALAKTEGCGRPGIVHLLDRLYLEEVVARSQAADLPEPALHGPRIHLGRVGAAHSTLVFAPLQVPVRPVAAFHGVAGAAEQYLLQFGVPGQPPHRAAPEPTGDGGVEPVHQAGEPGRELCVVDVGREQPDSAGDVKADSPARSPRRRPHRSPRPHR